MQTENTVAKGLGIFSLALGLAEVLAPHGVAKLAGLQDNAALTRALGAREIAAGVGVLGAGNPGPGLWARFVGDFIDLGVMSRSLKRPSPRLYVALGMVAGITLLDLWAARRFTK